MFRLSESGVLNRLSSMEERKWAAHRIRRVAPVVQEWARQNRREATESEAVLWAALRGKRLGGVKFRRQHPMGIYILDFWCPERRLCIELDGGYHEDTLQRASDEERDRTLRKNAVRVLRFTNDEVLTGLENVKNRILQNL